MTRTEDFEAVQRDRRVRYLKAMIAAEEALRQLDALKRARPRRRVARSSALPPPPRRPAEDAPYLQWFDYRRDVEKWRREASLEGSRRIVAHHRAIDELDRQIDELRGRR